VCPAGTERDEMAKFKHEQTNRKVNTVNGIKHWNKKSSYYGGWITLLNKYPAKCSVCNKYIAKNVKIYWHKTDRIVMHQSDCTV